MNPVSYIKPGLGAKLSRGNPLAKGLVLAMPFNEGRGTPFDLVRNNISSFVAGSTRPAWVHRANDFGVGTGMKITGGSSGYIFLATPKFAAFTSCTFVVRAYIDSTGAYAGFIGGSATQMCCSADGTKLGYNWNDDGSSQAFAGPTIPTNIWALFAVVVRPANMNAYIISKQGIATGSQTLAHASATISEIYIGSDDYQPETRTIGGIFDYALMYNRALSQAELWALYQNPYAFMQGPRPHFEWVQAAGGGSQDGTIAFGASSSSTFGAVSNAVGIIAAGALADAALGSVASALASMLAAAGAGHQGDRIMSGAGAMTAPADAAGLFAAISQAADAITAGVLAGESWAVQASALGELLAPVSAGGEPSGLAAALGTLSASADAVALFDGVMEGVTDAAVTEGSAAAASFLGAVASIANLVVQANAAAEFNSLTGSPGILDGGAAAGAQAGASVVAHAILSGAIFAGAAFSTGQQVFAILSAGFTAGSVFSLPAEIRMIIAGILISARIAGTVSHGPAVSASSISLDS